ncbi:hypothetical protein NQ317_012134 [Molorchus minor]|uniref:Phosphoinositide 5-phosphatase n=1 Tax=Molorchus minor TaxID=1323400 RepID=A0ABQ9K2I7_9CUCU|nr:hypothetical protein NQ317_012134 [Molorchus minor]
MLAVHQDVINIVQAKFLPAEVVKSKPISISDLSIEIVTPIDQHFSCDTEPIEESQSHIIFIVTCKKSILRFKIEIGVESSNFASEVIRSKEVSLHSTPVFVWLDKYSDIMNHTNRNSDFEEQPDTPITPIVRQRIVQGQMGVNRESMLKYQLKLKEPDYTEKQEFTIFVGTWNVNGQPPTVSLRPWLSSDQDPPDLYAIGFQEIDLSKEAFLFNDTPREAEWQKFVMEGVHPKSKYRLVALARLVGMQLAVMVNSQHYQYVKNVSYDTVGTGLLGKMGNKGGVAVRLELHNTSLCFVNCHLAAHVEEYERRNQDYKDINARMNFRRNPLAIKDHEQVYWLGDLNYRITELTTSQVKTLLQRKELVKLLKADQLNQQKERGNVLLDYTEGDINFQPTYKYDLNSDVFDTSEKARPPAWTDRILYRGKGICQVVYRSHMDMRISDHKPVSALFKSEISVIDPQKFRKIHEDLLKKMDKHENEYLPQVMIDQTEVIFDLVKFREPQAREIIIANTGMVPAEFEFIKKLDEVSYCKDWLRITPYCGSINPGGKDMFITVSGDCQRSCFSTSISTLCRIPVPILQLSEEQWKSAENNESGVLYSIPRELWLMVDHLYRHGLKMRELFESSALHEETIRIRDWLDTGSLDPMRILFNYSWHRTSCGRIFTFYFLSYTKDPVIPFELHDNCVAAASNFQNSRQVRCKCLLIYHLYFFSHIYCDYFSDNFAKVSDLHRNVFLYICMFLQELLKYSNDNGYDAKTLASLFGDILLKGPSSVIPGRRLVEANLASFYNFLVNDLSSSIIPHK